MARLRAGPGIEQDWATENYLVSLLRPLIAEPQAYHSWDALLRFLEGQHSLGRTPALELPRRARDRQALRSGETERILVVGTGDYRLDEAEQWVADYLGRALARAGYRLVGGGWPGVDHVTARAYANELDRMEIPIEKRFTNVVGPRATPDFRRGAVLNVEDYTGTVIEMASAVVAIGGHGATYQICRAALAANKPVFPIAGTRGDAMRVFLETSSSRGSAPGYARAIPNRREAVRAVDVLISELPRPVGSSDE
jgi:hypothetical protein